ncbi:MAG: PQQ-binding-like beta-propeller repeat protein, partial [Phycisphaerales bacterium]|nr:PQQ-binding-like beta-propeller repeat protein [Phycisphaerales bacterium]
MRTALFHGLALTILVAPVCGQEKGTDTTPTPIASWRFEESAFTGGVIPDRQGDLDVKLAKGGLDFTGTGSSQAVRMDETSRQLVVAEDIDPSTVLPPTAFSVASWVRLDSPSEWSGILSAVQDNGDYERGWVTGINGQRFYLGLASRDGAGITYLFSDRLAEPGRWHHLVTTYDGHRMRVYIDGRLDVESLEQGGPVNWPPLATIALGTYIDDDERHPLIGGLHSIELHDEALDEADVAGLFAERAGSFPEPVSPDDAIASRTPDTIKGWPMYRRDPQRSGATDDPLPENLVEAWQFQVAPPRPSWPEPAQRSFWQNIEEAIPRVVFDLAHHPVSDGNVAVFASAHDDHVRCIDLATGQLRWRAATDGPIRFAPVLHDGAVFVASDDGCLHRFDLDTGEPQWKVRLAPADRRIMGNGRLISAWPIRTGPVIDRGILHATSGLFPRFGTQAFAIDPASGDILWTRPLPGTSPQGYLLASSSRLFIPTGRTSPSTLGRGDGRNLGTFDLPGGTFALLVEDQLIAGPGSEGTLGSADSRTRETAASFQADRGIVVPDLVVLQRGDTLLAIDRPRLLALEASRASTRRQLAALQAIGKSGQRDVSAELDAARNELAALGEQVAQCELWRVEHPAS